VKQVYSSRRPGGVPISICLDREAALLLRGFCTSPRVMGRFISRLVYEHAARQESRQALLKTIEARIAEDAQAYQG
jgi:hypothetical protein